MSRKLTLLKQVDRITGITLMTFNLIQYSETRELPLESILTLYRANDWSSTQQPALLHQALLASHSLVTAWDDTKLIGLGNAISDGHLVVYYPHLLVLPEYQDHGIGSRLMQMLMARYQGFHQQMLVADRQAIEFYRKCGFERAGTTEPMWIYAGHDHTSRTGKQSIAQISLVVREYDEAINFYVGTLGFNLLEDTCIPEQDKRWVIVAPPASTESRLLLARATSEEQSSRIGDQTGGRVFLFLHTDDFWRDFHTYKSKGVVFVREPAEERYGTVAVFRDLYGNLWDLIQPRTQ